MFGFTRLTSTIRTAFQLSFFILLFIFGLVKPNFRLHKKQEKQKSFGVTVLIAVLFDAKYRKSRSLPYQSWWKPSPLLLIGQHDYHTPQRVQNLLGVFVTHRVFRGAVQQLSKEVLDLFDNGLLFFLGQIGIFRQPFGELLAALLRAGFTTDEVKDHLADGIFSALEPLYSLAVAAVNARRKRIPHVYQIADNKS